MLSVFDVRRKAQRSAEYLNADNLAIENVNMQGSNHQSKRSMTSTPVPIRSRNRVVVTSTIVFMPLDNCKLADLGSQVSLSRFFKQFFQEGDEWGGQLP